MAKFDFVAVLRRRHRAHHRRPWSAISILSSLAACLTIPTPFRVTLSSMAQGSNSALKLTSIDDNIVPNMEINVRTTLALDDELVAKAQAFTGLKEKSSLVREALKALIERESARRLARLGGSEPDLTASLRRRSNAA